MAHLIELAQAERAARDAWDAHLLIKITASMTETIAQELRGRTLFNEWYDARKAFDAALDEEATPHGVGEYVSRYGG